MPRQETGDQLWDSAIFADHLKLSPRAFYHALARGQLPTPIKVGNRLRWRPEQIQAFLDESQRVEQMVRQGGQK